ncbi:MAG: DNA translocase FtsK, partial [Chloroflexi bacterium]|nr:DNA translocase FtsK [Chloroflexota bacterium]
MVKGKSRGSLRWWLRPLGWLLLPPGLYLTLLVVLASVIYWRRELLLSLVSDIFYGTLRLFGWGLVFIVIAIGALAIVVWRRKLPSLIRGWNYWLGASAFVLAIWGLLAFFPGQGVLRRVSLGGNIGLNLIGSTDFIGALRLLLLIIAGVILIAPRASLRFVAKSFSWLGRRFKRQPSATFTHQEEPSLPSVTVSSKPLPAKPRKETVAPIVWLGKQLKRQPAAIPPRQYQPPVSPVPVTDEPPEIAPGRRTAAPGFAPTSKQTELKQVAQEVWKKYGETPNLVTIDGWRLPPIDILDVSPEVQFSQADNVQRAKLIEEALASYGVEAKVVQINAGPTVTQFGIEPGWDRKTKELKEKDRYGNVQIRQEEVSRVRVKVERISSLANDLALALAAPSIRIEAPVPGKAVVGIEVPNTISGVVSLRGVIETSVFQKLQAKSRMSLALGKGAGGEAVVADLTKMPHLLIAGATGSGKTVCLNSTICCLLLYNTPNDVRFVMIDPKRVELTMFNGIPHLAAPVIVDADKALEALRWLAEEMNRRYQTLATASVRNIESYNKNRQGAEKMPFLVLVIDELADLMMSGGDEVEHILCRLAQLSRAVGIHLVVATQRPSVDVITGLIKANFPTRISSAVASQVDSRTILDTGGAEKLLGKGDMLYMPTEAGKPKR